MLRNRSHFSRLAGAALLAVVVSACSVVEGKQSGEEYMDDASITTKVKTSLASDVGLTPANQIHVETSNRVVQLSAFVDTPAHKAQAMAGLCSGWAGMGADTMTRARDRVAQGMHVGDVIRELDIADEAAIEDLNRLAPPDRRTA